MTFKESRAEHFPMELETSSSRRNRLVRSTLALVLAGVAVVSLRKGRRLRGTLAGVGAVALGYGATAGEATEHIEFGATEEEEDVDLRCAICGDPIRPGQARGPNENNDVVHEACRESVEQ